MATCSDTYRYRTLGVTVANPSGHSLLGVGHKLLGKADQALATYIRFR
jgi:hypothetical protein